VIIQLGQQFVNLLLYDKLQYPNREKNAVGPVHNTAAEKNTQVLAPTWCNIPLGLTLRTELMPLKKKKKKDSNVSAH